MLSEQWSSLVVLRPGTENALVEDSHLGTRIATEPRALANEILKNSNALNGLGTSTTTNLPDAQEDWVSKGWAPSLDYFNWSEADSQQSRRPATVPAVHTSVHEASARWDWSEPKPAPQHDPTVGEILINRKTTREYNTPDLEPSELAAIFISFAQLLNSSDAEDRFLTGLRFAGIVYELDGVEPGVWDLQLSTRSAGLVRPGLYRDEMVALMCGMQAAMTANGTIVIVVDFAKRQQAFPYERALRELYIDVARVAQWFIAACESRGVGCLITPATNDRVLSELLKLGPNEAPVYTVTFGKRYTRNDIEEA